MCIVLPNPTMDLGFIINPQELLLRERERSIQSEIQQKYFGFTIVT